MREYNNRTEKQQMQANIQIKCQYEMLLVRSYVGEPKSDKNTKFILARRNIQNSKLNIKHKFSTTTTTKSNKKRGFLCKLT